ncbi:MAG: hotdog fold thioesterase [Aeromicrobium sp.]
MTPEVTGDELARRCADVMWAGDNASRHLKMELREVSCGRSVMAMVVQDFMVNGWGMCHGGYISTLADSAFAFACNSHNVVTVASGFDIDFRLPVGAGEELIATAVESSREGRNGLYDVSVCRETDGGREIVAEMQGRSRSLGKPILG